METSLNPIAAGDNSKMLLGWMDSMRELYITTEVKHVAEIFRDVSLQDKTTGAHTELNQYKPRTRSNLLHSTAQFCMSSQSALNHHGAIRYRRRSSKDIVPAPEAAPGVGVPILIAMLVTLFNVTPKVAKSCKGMTHSS